MASLSPRRSASRRLAVLLALVVGLVAVPVDPPVGAASRKTVKKVVRKTTRKPVIRRATSPVTSTTVAPTTVATTPTIPAAATAAAPSTTTAPTAAAPASFPTTPFSGVNRPYGPLLERVMKDLDQFWGEQMPIVYGRPYRPLTGLYWYTSQQLPPQCSTPVTYREIVNNAFYCVAMDYIAWDDERLFPTLQRTYGDVSLAVVLAHEIGHAIQQRAGVYTTTIYKELQADCFSGAWMARAFSGRSPLVSFPMSSLDEAVSAVLAFRDQPGIDANDVRAHGNGFDRLNALQLGYEGGVARCANFVRSQPPAITATAFSSVEERQTGGNVPYAQAISVAIAGLNGYWPTVIPGFPTVTRVPGTDPAGMANLGFTCLRRTSLFDDRVGVCDLDADGNPTVAYDDARLQAIYSTFKDFGTGMVLALGWAVLVQAKLGEPTSSTSVAAELKAACYAGSWVGAMATNKVPGVLGLSPGDIDEALMLLVAVPGKAPTFDRIRNLRTGFFGGFGACRTA